MILDKLNTFSDAQAVTSSVASTDYINQLAAGGAIQRPAYLEVRVDTLATSTDSATVAFSLQSADDSAFSTNLTTHFSSGAIAKADLTAGKVVAQTPLPQNLRQYVRVYYTVAVADLTGGKFDAYIVDTPSVRPV
jgi:hypothetical protein